MTDRPESVQPTIRVAIVDDDAISRAGVRVELDRDATIQVDVECDHDEALAAMSTWSDIDVVILDAAAPGPADELAGLVVTKALRATPRFSRTRIVILTGRLLSEPMARFHVAGADAFVDRLDTREAGTIRDIVLHPELSATAPPAPDLARFEALGIRPADAEHLVDVAQGFGVVDAIHRAAPGVNPFSTLSRRRDEAVRRHLAEAGLRPVDASGRPRDASRLPTWRQVTETVRALTKFPRL